MEHKLVQVCFYINKRLNISSWNATHYYPNLYTIYLNIFHIGKLHIYNIYNLIAFSNSYFGQLLKLNQVITLFLLKKHIISDDFNLYHLIWRDIEAYSDNNAENL